MTDARPLADILRPRTLDEVVGQQHLVGTNGIIRKFLASGFLPSMVLWGPPGTGKTTLARLLATMTDSHFEAHSAVTSSLADIRRVVKEAEERNTTYSSGEDTIADESRSSTRDANIGIPLDTEYKPLPASPLEKGRSRVVSPLEKGRSDQKSRQARTILFIDEIHRFNKAQQDALLPHVEHGTVIFIGATTENPSFEVISPLLSRCRVLVLKPLTEDEQTIITKRGLEYLHVSMQPDAQKFLMEVANGDARSLLNILEISNRLKDSQQVSDPKKNGKKRIPDQVRDNITKEDIEEAAQRKMLQYDTGGDEHYNTISAFIKSMRASDADAALYYLARMVNAGEDPLFIARRMIVFASEDIGLAQPTALVVANAVFDACHKIGYPECQENLAHGVAYLAHAKKDRSAYDAFMAALDDVRKLGNLPIPMSIRNAPTKLMKNLGYGKGYTQYTRESLLPEKLKGKVYLRTLKKDG